MQLDQKMFGSFGISHIEAPQPPSHELSPGKQAQHGVKALWDQVILGLTNVIAGLSTNPDCSENNQKHCYIYTSPLINR